MTRLLEIEWLKLRSYKVFWVLLAMYVIGVVFITSGIQFFFEFLKNKGAEFQGLDPTIIPFYDFPDIWHNITYIATFLKVLLAFIVIISVCNEISYRTLRQNIIDGLSKKDFVISKLSLITVLALGATILLFLTGLFNGLAYSQVAGIKYIFRSLDFLGAYFIEVVTYLCFAFLVALLLRKTGFVIVTVFMYTLIFEPIIIVNIEHNPFLPGFLSYSAPFWPVEALNNLIRFPYQRYVFMEVQDNIAFEDLLIVLGWLVVYIRLITWRLSSKDI